MARINVYIKWSGSDWNYISTRNCGDKINFKSTCAMNCFATWYLPLITSITASLFCYEVMEFLASRIGALRWVDFISENTFTIMMVHLFFANIPNFCVFFMGRNAKFTSFDLPGFQREAWMSYGLDMSIIAFFCGLCGGLLVSYVMRRIKQCRKQ